MCFRIYLKDILLLHTHSVQTSLFVHMKQVFQQVCGSAIGNQIFPDLADSSHVLNNTGGKSIRSNFADMLTSFSFAVMLTTDSSSIRSRYSIVSGLLNCVSLTFTRTL